jgi:hypothetical protein
LSMEEGPLVRTQSPSSADTCDQSQKGLESSSKSHWVRMARKKESLLSPQRVQRAGVRPQSHTRRGRSVGSLNLQETTIEIWETVF